MLTQMAARPRESRQSAGQSLRRGGAGLTSPNYRHRSASCSCRRMPEENPPPPQPGAPGTAASRCRSSARREPPTAGHRRPPPRTSALHPFPVAARTVSRRDGLDLHPHLGAELRSAALGTARFGAAGPPVQACPSAAG